MLVSIERALPRAAFACLLGLAGCASIPEVDTEPPVIELRISGPGVGSKRMANPPMARWSGEGGSQFLTLREDATYRFSLTVTDQGGVARATLALPASLEVFALSGDGLVNEVSGITRRLTLTGDRSDPVRILALSGQFRTRGNAGLAPSFDGESSDFGGRSGTEPNQRFLSVSAFID